MQTTSKPHTRAGRLAMTGLAGGIAASLAMNLQAINLAADSPGIGAYVSAVVWPSALFVAIEVMLHTPWNAGVRDALTKWLGLLSVAGMSAWVSYWHGVHVLSAFHYDAVSSHFGPVAVDMMMAMAALALNRVGQARRTPDSGQAVSTGQATTVATTGQATTVADEASDYLARLSAEVATTEPVLPVPVSPAPAPVAAERSAPRSRLDLRELAAVLDGLANHVDSDKRADELAAGHYGVSARTIRRARASIKAVAQAESALT